MPCGSVCISAEDSRFNGIFMPCDSAELPAEDSCVVETETEISGSTAVGSTKALPDTAG